VPGRTIHILPEQVASQIAAGEVVERPASAVKELVENSLDAGAGSITVEIERGGMSAISVGDDGCGMSREDALLSVRRHATSKIRRATDLNAVRTFGFRGEALASIASVAEMRLQTRLRGEDCGVELLVAAGNVEEVRDCPLAPGTRIEVRNLFFNTPARLKFLKTVVTEQAAVVEVVQRAALANRRTIFRFSADGRLVFELSRAASLLERTRQLFGSKLAERMLSFAFARESVSISGLASVSQQSFAAPRLIFTYVNNRPVRDRMLLRAIARAYESLLPRGRHPAVALFIDLPAGEVDVNVHPMKTEVRFRHSGQIFELVYSVLRERLKDQTVTEIALKPFGGNSDQPAPPTPARSVAAKAEEANDTIDSKPTLPHMSLLDDGAWHPASRPLRLVADPAMTGISQVSLRLGFTQANRTLYGEATASTSRLVPQYSSFRVIGQLFAGFIALEGEDRLILVDQHAAHERITFERLRAQLQAGAIRVQPMLTPIVFELNPSRAGPTIAALPELRVMGFEVEVFGPTTVLLKGTPAVFGATDGRQLFSDFLDSIGESGLRLHEVELESWLKTISCHGSLRMGRVLTMHEISSLLEQLDRTEFKTNCPHGRPVHIEFRRTQLERMFRR
jgi:DNA mismatch repair protein MutL